MNFNYKQVLDDVFVISRILKVEVGVISQNRRLRFITLTETGYHKKPTLLILLLYIEPKRKMEVVFCFFMITNGNHHKGHELVDMITFRNHARQSYKRVCCYCQYKRILLFSIIGIDSSIKGYS